MTEDRRVRPGRSRNWVQFVNTLGPLLALVFVYGIFALLIPEERGFTSFRAAQMIIIQTAIVGIAALGMTMIIIMGGIDLSAGSIIALATVVIALALNSPTINRAQDSLPGALAWLLSPALIAAILGVLAAGLCGGVNGALITRLKMTPFIVTLGMLLLVRGVTKGLAKEQKVDAPFSWLNNLLAMPGKEPGWVDNGFEKFIWFLYSMPSGVKLMLVLAVVVAALLRYTRFGRHVFAIGSNELTARLCGVEVEKTKTRVYALGGLFAGLAGLMQFSRLSVGDPTVAVGLELNVIAAVVIGGGSLSGGEGSILGTLVGALIMTIIGMGCTMMEWPNWIQEIATGAIIVIAVALDRVRHRRTCE